MELDVTLWVNNINYISNYISSRDKEVTHILCARTATMACLMSCILMSTKPYGDNTLDSCKHNIETKPSIWCEAHLVISHLRALQSQHFKQSSTVTLVTWMVSDDKATTVQKLINNNGYQWYHTRMRLSGGALRRADMYSQGGQVEGLSGPSIFCNHKVRHSKMTKQYKNQYQNHS